MISFRYHVVTLVSVFLALAVGIALGGGPLQGEVDDSLVGQLHRRHICPVLQTTICRRFSPERQSHQHRWIRQVWLN